jgi:chemotaxis protein MotB
MKTRYGLALVLVVLVGFSGCAKNKELEQKNLEQQKMIDGLNQEIAKLNGELANATKSTDELAKAKAELERKLRGELSAGDLELALKDRGLVITFLDRVLFSSGKAELKPSAQGTLEKIVSILNQRVPDKVVYVDGHTDNIPIRYSTWRSNWDLSTGRALEVTHFLIEKGVNPSRLVVCGYGEYSPVADNGTPEGRQKNRRVEVIVSPKNFRDLLPKKQLS